MKSDIHAGSLQFERTENKTISGSLSDFRKTWRVTSLVDAVSRVISEGRVVEALYGAWCFTIADPPLRGRKTAIVDGTDIASLIGWKHDSNLSVDDCAALYPTFGWRALSPKMIFRCHAVVRCGRWLLAGEYGDPGARLFLLSGDHVRMNSFYETCAGVRHVHAIHALDEQTFAVTT